jgi:antagonist of KipI
VKPFLGSASTHLLSGLGGHEGRALRKGDVLKIGDAPEAAQKGTGQSASSTKGAHGVSGTGISACSSFPSVDGSHHTRKISAAAMKHLAPRKTLRVTPGPQNDWFSTASRRVFYANAYRVTEEANRMGLRLDGTPLPEGAHGEMISEGVSLGAIQIAAGGLPIILFVEQQTTGGYAKIANVISADLHSLGQLRPRDEIRFELVSFATARKLLIEREKLLASEDLIEGTRG